MNSEPPVVLVVGATGRTGRLVVEAAARLAPGGPRPAVTGNLQALVEPSTGHG